MAQEPQRKLYRSRTDRVLLGVSGGLGKYLDIDPTLIRIFFIILTLVGGSGVIIYLILALMIPNEPVSTQAAEPTMGQSTKEFAKDVQERAQQVADGIKSSGWGRDTRNIFGLVVVILGVLLLAQQLLPGTFYWLRWSLVWPVLIILFGLLLIGRRR